jgi:hypothetical protein
VLNMNILANFLVFFLICSSAWAGVLYDAADDVLNCGTADIIQEDQPFTFCTWFYANSAGEGSLGRLFFRRGNVGDTQGVGFSLNSDVGNDRNLEVFHNRASGATTFNVRSSDGVFSLSTWTHACVTSPGTMTAADWDIYVNGTEVTYEVQTNGDPAQDTSGQTLKIGNRTDGGRTFDGIIGETAIWTVELTAAEVSLLANAKTARMPLQVQKSSLAYFWPMLDEEDGTSADGDTFLDLSGNGRNCTGDDGAGNTGLTAKAEAVLSHPY